MSTDDIKSIMRRYTETVFNQRDLSRLEEFLAPNFVDHDGAPEPGPGPVRQGLTVFLGAFPDLRIEILDMVAEDDKLACRYVISGTHLGDLFGLAPTGRRAVWQEQDITRFAGGQLVERWATEDRLGQQQQLGLLPSG